MERARYVIVGAGVTGLAFANFIEDDDVLILERDTEIGGYCKTVKQDGFVWDYSGHFFHFRDPAIERYLVDRIPDGEIRTVTKSARVLYKGELIDFPFQKNIHQLPQQEFIDCLYDMVFREQGDVSPESFAQMLYARFGRSIAEKFLIPYNSKLYACDLETLDHDAMGRFFPYADLEQIIANFRRPDNASYNATFTYPSGGAIEYVKALYNELDPARVQLGDGVTRIDLAAKEIHTASGRVVGFDYLISSAPFNRLLEMTGLPDEPGALTSNKVVVFNLGFDRKGWRGVHWVYVPESEYVFYRVGFYDNIFDTDRMSLYIEIGRATDDPVDTEALLAQSLADLRRAGICDGHELVSWHTITLDPAYVHIRQPARELVEQTRRLLQARGVYTVGRYGGWTYCSIEDNIMEARSLARDLNTLHAHIDQP